MCNIRPLIASGLLSWAASAYLASVTGACLTISDKKCNMIRERCEARIMKKKYASVNKNVANKLLLEGVDKKPE